MGKGKGIGIGIGAGIGIAVVGLILIVGIDSFPGQDEYSELRSLSDEELETMSVKDWETDDVLRNFSNYEGEIVRFHGDIFRAEHTDKNHYLLSVWKFNQEDDIVIVDYTGSRLLNGDSIRVYGVIDSIIELESAFDEDLKNPYLLVKAIRVYCLDC